MMKVFSACLLLAAPVMPVDAQPVPEGVHSEAQGPSTICGITGRDALDLKRQVTASAAYRLARQTDRFDLYVSADERDQWLFTHATEPAHPAATCRRLSQDAAGSWFISRQLRCDATRDACDRLFLELRALDDQTRQALAR